MKTITVKDVEFFAEPPTANGASTIDITYSNRYRLQHSRIEGKGYQIDFTSKSKNVAKKTAVLIMEKSIRDLDIQTGATYYLKRWLGYSGIGVSNGGFWTIIAYLEVIEEGTVNESGNEE